MMLSESQSEEEATSTEAETGPSDAKYHGPLPRHSKIRAEPLGVQIMKADKYSTRVFNLPQILVHSRFLVLLRILIAYVFFEREIKKKPT